MNQNPVFLKTIVIFWEQILHRLEHILYFLEQASYFSWQFLHLLEQALLGHILFVRFLLMCSAFSLLSHFCILAVLCFVFAFSLLFLCPGPGPGPRARPGGRGPPTWAPSPGPRPYSDTPSAGEENSFFRRDAQHFLRRGACPRNPRRWPESDAFSYGALIVPGPRGRGHGPGHGTQGIGPGPRARAVGPRTQPRSQM